MGGYFCVILVYLWSGRRSIINVHPLCCIQINFWACLTLWGGFVLVCLLRTKLFQASLVSTVLFRCWPGKHSLGTSGGGAAEDNTHLLREKPPTLHQETRSQHRRLEWKISHGRWRKCASGTIKVIKNNPEKGMLSANTNPHQTSSWWKHLSVVWLLSVVATLQNGF